MMFVEKAVTVQDNATLNEQPIASKILETHEYGRIVEDRAKLKNRLQNQRCTFVDPSLKLVYHNSLLPGVFFYRYLAPAVNSNSQRSLKEEGSHILRIWLPDTLIYGDGGDPLWVFSDKDGYIRRSSSFNDNEVAEMFSNHRFEKDFLALCKEPTLADASTASEAIHSYGNYIRLLNYKDLKALTTRTSAMNAKKHLVIQRFIKSKGPKAHLVRVVYQMHKPLSAWMINSNIPFEDENESNTLSRFCTASSRDNSKLFIQLHGKACADVAVNIMKIVKFLEQRFARHFELLGCDFLKDDEDKWWLLQVKYFRFQGSTPENPIGLSSSLRKKFGIFLDHIEGNNEKKTRIDRFSNRIRIPKNKEYKTGKCKSCAVSYPIEELPFKMTLKMIYDTTYRIKYRLSHDKKLKWFGNVTGRVSSIKNSSSNLHRSLVSSDKTPNYILASHETSLFYQPFNVCKLCYNIYENEQALSSIEEKFSSLLGLPKDSQLLPLSLGGKKAVNVLSLETQDQNLTLCRLIFFFHGLHDFPIEIAKKLTSLQENWEKERNSISDEVSSSSSLSLSCCIFLRYELLGYEFLIPVDNKIEELNQMTEEGETKTIFWLPIREFRTLHFFCPNTPLNRPSKETTGLSSFLSKHPNILVELVYRVNSTLVQTKSTLDLKYSQKCFYNKENSSMEGNGFITLGQTKINIQQFKSPYVKKNDVYDSMHISDYTLNIKASVAFDRIRIIPFDNITALWDLRHYEGVYLPPCSFKTNDLLPVEWLLTLPLNNNIPLSTEIIETTEEKEKEKFKRKQENKEINTKKLYIENNFEEELYQEAKILDHENKFNEINSQSKEFERNTKDFKVDEMSIKRNLNIEEWPESLWCITVMFHRTHNLFSDLNHLVWEADYCLFGTSCKVLQKAQWKKVEDSSRTDDAVLFDSTHHHFLQGPLQLLEKYIKENSVLKILLESQDRDYHSKEKSYICNVNLNDLIEYRELDGTYDIIDLNGNSISLDSSTPYLSASFNFFRIGPTKRGNSLSQKFVVLHSLGDGLDVCKKVD